METDDSYCSEGELAEVVTKEEENHPSTSKKPKLSQLSKPRPSIPSYRMVNGNSPVAKDFAGIVDLPALGVINYEKWGCIMDTERQYQKMAFHTMHIRDFQGPHPSYIRTVQATPIPTCTVVSITESFAQDQTIPAEFQPYGGDTRSSKYKWQSGHVVPAIMFRKNKKLARTTNMCTNLLVQTAAVNSEVCRHEQVGRHLLTTYGKVLTIYVSFLPDSESDIKYLKEEEKKVAIAKKFARVYIWRNEMGPHCMGLQTACDNYDVKLKKVKGKKDEEETDTGPKTYVHRNRKGLNYVENPLDMLKAAGIPLLVEESFFRSINGVEVQGFVDSAANQQIYPFYEEFWALFREPVPDTEDEKIFSVGSATQKKCANCGILIMDKNLAIRVRNVSQFEFSRVEGDTYHEACFAEVRERLGFFGAASELENYEELGPIWKKRVDDSLPPISQK